MTLREEHKFNDEVLSHLLLTGRTRAIDPYIKGLPYVNITKEGFVSE